MGEKLINPILNVHEEYRKVNIINPYRFGPTYVIPTDGLLAYYKFDGDNLDYSGNGKTAVLAGSTAYATGRKGVANTGLTLNGTNAYFRPPSLTSIRCISVWLKPNGADNQASYKVEARNSLPNGYWGGGQLNLTGFNRTYMNGVVNTNSSYGLASSAWTHVYLEGNINWTGAITFGARSPGTDGYWNGVYDDIRIYSRPLTVAEITACYMEP